MKCFGVEFLVMFVPCYVFIFQLSIGGSVSKYEYLIVNLIFPTSVLEWECHFLHTRQKLPHFLPG